MNIKFTLLIFTMGHWVECGCSLVGKDMRAQEAVLLDKPGATYSFQICRQQQNPASCSLTTV